jgi:flagellar basal body-associated protein FliL
MNVPWWIIIVLLVLAAAGIGFLAAWWIHKNSATRTNATGGKSQEETNENSFWFGLGYSGAAALTAILIPLLLWFGLQAGKHWMPAPESYADSLIGPSIMVTLVVIASVIGLLAVLMMTALAFSSVKLADPAQALGLPGGKSQEETNENSFWFGLGYSGAACAR